MVDLAASKKAASDAKVSEPVQRDEPKFRKDQILASKKFKNRRDLLSAVLEDGQLYTMPEVNTLVEKYMKGTVK